MLDVLAFRHYVADASRRSAELEQAAAAGQRRVFDQLDASLAAIKRSREILLDRQRWLPLGVEQKQHDAYNCQRRSPNAPLTPRER
jgi:hypothetical protein